jgi:type II secretory pathway component PulC
MLKSDGMHFAFLKSLAVFFMLLTFCGSLQAEEIVYDPGKRRDPFLPITGEDVSVSASSSGVRLEGIIYDPGAQSMAILNGKTYQVGEGIGDAKVLRILKDHVVIFVEGEEKTLWIRKEEKT